MREDRCSLETVFVVEEKTYFTQKTSENFIYFMIVHCTNLLILHYNGFNSLTATIFFSLKKLCLQTKVSTTKLYMLQRNLH